MRDLTIPPEVPRPAAVLLVHRRGWIGALIRWVTASPWNHAALIEGAKHGDEGTTIEAKDLSGVQHSTLRGYCEDPDVLGLAVYDRPDLTMAQRWAICEWADRHNGARYDTKQLLGIYLRRRLPLLHRWRNRLDNPDRPICSELVGRAYEAAGVSLCPPGVQIGCLAPSHLTETMQRTWEGWRSTAADAAGGVQ